MARPSRPPLTLWPICRTAAAVQRRDIDSLLHFDALAPIWGREVRARSGSGVGMAIHRMQSVDRGVGAACCCARRRARARRTMRHRPRAQLSDFRLPRPDRSCRTPAAAAAAPQPVTVAPPPPVTAGRAAAAAAIPPGRPPARRRQRHAHAAASASARLRRRPRRGAAAGSRAAARRNVAAPPPANAPPPGKPAGFPWLYALPRRRPLLALLALVAAPPAPPPRARSTSRAEPAAGASSPRPLAARAGRRGPSRCRAPGSSSTSRPSAPRRPLTEAVVQFELEIANTGKAAGAQPADRRQDVQRRRRSRTRRSAPSSAPPAARARNATCPASPPGTTGVIHGEVAHAARRDEGGAARRTNSCSSRWSRSTCSTNGARAETGQTSKSYVVGRELESRARRWAPSASTRARASGAPSASASTSWRGGSDAQARERLFVDRIEQVRRRQSPRPSGPAPPARSDRDRSAPPPASSRRRRDRPHSRRAPRPGAPSASRRPRPTASSGTG